MFRSVLSAARRALRVQYASDLHLEFLSDKPVFPALLKPVAPVLVLAGDIGQPQRRSYRDLLHHCSRNWDDVVIVAGNHELYGGHVTQRLELCRAMALEFGNVHFLERDRVVCHGVTFFGCTLWTQDSTPRLNDYRRIEAENGSMLTVADTNRWHGRDKEWLRLALANTEGPTVVVTHHLPSFRLIAPEFEGSPLNSGFASDCDALIAPPVSVWIAGHTHRAMRVRFENGVVAAVNPRGYPDELGDVTGHSREAVVEVPLGPTGPSGEGAATDDGFLDRMAAAHANSALSGFTTVDAQIVEDDVVFV